MKNAPMKHQTLGVRIAKQREYFAWLGEQGTGKSYMVLDEAEQLFAANKIDGLFIIAPKGVHTNWIRKEVPKHMSAQHRAAYYVSGATQREQRAIEELLKPRGDDEPRALRILAMNVDAVNTDGGMAVARRFLQAMRVLMVVDESQRIKNPTAARTKRVIELGRRHTAYRRIASGTLIADSPLDAYSQFDFLAPGLLGTTSFRAFVAEYAELLPDSSNLVQHIKRRDPRSRPQIVARDKVGRPRWRNKDKLTSLIAPHSYRVLKSECLDLPEKIYKTVYFKMTPAQRQAYKLLEDELRFEVNGQEVVTVSALGAMVKLQQITSGFLLHKGVPTLVTDKNPRLELLMDLLNDIPEGEQVIVWARFREELRAIAAALRHAKVTTVEYHGGVSVKDRLEVVDAFQSGAARVFVGQPQSGGVGLTLTAATHVIYFSNDFSLETRMQSEDRAHRIGTTVNVIYIDLIAEDTIDEVITAALNAKEDVACSIMNALNPQHAVR